MIILDGWGINPNPEANAVEQANLPFYKSALQNFPHCEIMTSGEYVGLPDGQMGNSEVGHLNIGAGRVVYQELLRINKAIRDRTLFKNSRLVSLMESARENRKSLHFIGLVSDGGVHSHIEHLLGLLEMAKEKNLSNVFVHVFLDGRDTPPKSGSGYIRQLEEFMARIKTGKIATVSGRYYAMDRDRRWDRVQKAWDAMVSGKGNYASTAQEAIEKSYRENKTDEFLLPTVILENGQPVGPVRDGDGILFFNFRADRARELTLAFTGEDFSRFPVEHRPRLGGFATMTQYDETFKLPVLFPPYSLTNLLGEIISRQGMKQLRIAETEKYAHVTYFFNGGRETVYPGEERILIPSPREVATYDEKPQMSAPEVTENLIREIKNGKFGFIVLNLANPDMVGHTGSLPAAILAAETVDQCLQTIVQAVQKKGGTVLITADHGNLEQMVDYKTGQPHTAHTTNPVPFILISKKKYLLREKGVLADIAPTILEMMGIPQPKEMTGQSLISPPRS